MGGGAGRTHMINHEFADSPTRPLPPPRKRARRGPRFGAKNNFDGRGACAAGGAGRLRKRFGELGPKPWRRPTPSAATRSWTL